MPLWYFVNQIGMATVCADKSDAEKEASVADQAWPRHAPHVVMQLVDAAQLDSERAARQAAQLRIEELQAQLVRADAERFKAVAAEREACAIMAWSCGMDFYKPVSPADSREIGSKIARLIRARGSK